MSRRTTVVAAAIFALATTVRSEVIFVPDDEPTIQSAIESAAPVGDTILVWPGTYQGTVDYLGKEVAVRSLAGPELTIIDAERQGSAVSFQNGEGPGAVLDGFTVTGGYAVSGGGILVASGTSPTLTSCIVRGNEAGTGGGLAGYGDLAMAACRFIDNVAGDGGGASLGGGAKTLYGCTFEGNEAQYAGGIGNGAEALTLIDCVFDGNTTTEGWGGAMWSWGPALTARNCTFTRNAPALPYGAIFIEVSEPFATVTLIDTVFSDNVGDGIQSNGPSDVTLSGCLFSGNTGSGAVASYARTRVEDCEFRDHGGRGLALFSAEAIVTRSIFSSNSGGGLRLDAHVARVEECMFDENTSGRGAGVSIGGADVTLDRCTFIGNHASQSGGAVWTDSSSIPRIFDCEFRQNTADGSGGALFFNIYCQANDSIFEANRADVGGAVATGQAGTVAVPFTDCEFTGNTARRGGAFHLAPEQVLGLTRCRVSGNVAVEAGGGILTESAAVIATNCTIDQNRAAAGGGVYAAGGTLYGQSSFVNCLITRNIAATGGGVHLSTETEPALVNTTFFGNAATAAGGALFCAEKNSLTLANCVLWGNDAPAGHEISNASGDAVAIRYSDIEGCGGSGDAWDEALGADAGGNIDADPRFVDAPTVLWLGAGSPCIDAADNGAVPPGVTTDVDGLPRFVDDPAAVDTGAGDPPIVDMGAHERQPGCVGDVDEDGSAGFSDLVAILAAWGRAGGPEDLDGSGVVGFGDIVVLLASWGPCP